MEADQPVLVIGASGIDIKARTAEPFQIGSVHQGIVRTTVGGVARNIAENLARLEVPTILLSAVGEDRNGELVLSRAEDAGVDTSRVLRLAEKQTGIYLALLGEEGKVVASVSDYGIMSNISPSYLQRQRALFAEAAMVVIDASLSVKALATIFRLAKRYGVPVCADPTTQALSAKLVRYLPEIYMAAPDAREAAALCGGGRETPMTSEAAIEAAQCLVNMGVKIAIVTLAEKGLAYADSSGGGHIAALRTAVVDKTGVGDALTAAVIFGLLNDMPLDEAVRLGISAASLTLQTRETVAPDLSLDRIYDALVV